MGLKGAKAFLKFAEHHPWKTCMLHLYQEESNQGSGSLHKVYGIITPSDEEKRLYQISAVIKIDNNNDFHVNLGCMER